MFGGMYGARDSDAAGRFCEQLPLATSMLRGVAKWSRTCQRRTLRWGMPSKLALFVLVAFLCLVSVVSAGQPNIVLVMTDDQGWGDTGYNGHPRLKTPQLDALAREGVRLDRFYSAHFNCSPTRGSVLTGRHPNRYGTFSPGKPIRAQEITLAQIAQRAGYATGHFGKWHLNGVAGPGKPIAADDPLNPGKLGFDEWVSASNYVDLDTQLARQGVAEQFTGDSSDAITGEALKFIQRQAEAGKPFLAVVWFGSPHVPHRALATDKEPYADLPEKDQDYYGELAAVDRNVGRLRATLRECKVAEDTIFWFCSDNGGANGPLSTGHLRGMKGTLWEGGIRVPGLLAWPARFPTPLIADLPCSTSDMLPTLLAAMGAKHPDASRPLDGQSLLPLLEDKAAAREMPLRFWDHLSNHAALIDWPWKLHTNPKAPGKGRKGAAAGKDEAMPEVLLYDLSKDPKETVDLASQEPERAAKLAADLEQWQASVTKSLAGADYAKSSE